MKKCSLYVMCTPCEEICHSLDDQLGESNRDPRTYGKEKKESTFACGRSQDRELLCREVSYTVSLKSFQKECFESFPYFHRL